MNRFLVTQTGTGCIFGTLILDLDPKTTATLMAYVAKIGGLAQHMDLQPVVDAARWLATTAKIPPSQASAWDLD